MPELVTFRFPDHDRCGDRRRMRIVRRAAGLLFSGLCGAALCTCVPGFTLAGNTDEPAASDQAPAAGNGDLTPSVLLDDLENGSREKQARLARLRMQLQRLSEESRRIQEQPPQVHTPPTPAIDEPPMPAAEADLEPLLPELAPSDTHVVPDPPGDEAPAHQSAPPAPEPAAHSTETIVGTSINRLALGDSLFGTGQTDLALQAYSSIELNRMAATDRYWIEYQIANCHRRIGNIPEAQQRYRKLAGLVDAGWCAGHARWWLDALNTRAALQKDLAAVRNSLKLMEEQLNAQPPR